MIAILVLLKALLLRSVLEAMLQAMSEDDRRKYHHGENVRKALTTCQRRPQNDLQQSALDYYDSVKADVDEKLKAKLAGIKSNADCFIELLRLSGFPEAILCSLNVYQPIILAYVHIKSMSDHLRTIRKDSPDLLSQLEAYSKLLAVFTPSIISEILREIKKQESDLVRDINTVCVMQFCSFSQVLAGLMQPNSVEFIKLRAFALLNAAMVETDVSKWSPDIFKTMKDCVVFILGNATLTTLQKLEFIMMFVQMLINLLEKTSLWKTDGFFFGENFRIMFDTITPFSRLGFVISADYTTVLQKFPDSEFPAALKDFSSFLNSKLWDNYTRLKYL